MPPRQAAAATAARVLASDSATDADVRLRAVAAAAAAAHSAVLAQLAALRSARGAAEVSII
jgi:hypothetical protein